MRIGELARRSGLTPSKIRFYEAQGLITQVKRQGNGYRDYLPHTVHLLEIITSAQQSGFSLSEIQHLLPTPDFANWNREELLSTLRNKVAEIEALQHRLELNKARLLAVIDQTVNKPVDRACSANAEQVIEVLRSSR
ncbi:MerR family transcriptional regulator [Pseudomonas sp. J452]|uniref:MerR family transcriptional regulator n=1 Tax=Pseudomonas sp. J452 TaxID=2898441 RepID=UPI0021AD8F83|nr:MerR family transcriptional regulator [Pseudomonas sp. J452]UUY08653.1 MerR family transcriptional regulator [Pseudomonas sp. J452]